MTSSDVSYIWHLSPALWHPSCQMLTSDVMGVICSQPLSYIMYIITCREVTSWTVVGCNPTILCSVRLPYAFVVVMSLLHLQICVCWKIHCPSVPACCPVRGTPLILLRVLTYVPLCQSRFGTARGSLWNYVSMVCWGRCIRSRVPCRRAPLVPASVRYLITLSGNYSHSALLLITNPTTLLLAQGRTSEGLLLGRMGREDLGWLPPWLR